MKIKKISNPAKCPVNSVDCPSDDTLRDFAAGKLPHLESDLEERIAECTRCKSRAWESGASNSAGLDTVDSSPRQKPSSSVFQESKSQKNAILFAGDYELLEELGAGGMGVVYKAHQKSLDRIVAIKCIRSGTDAEPVEIARFENEVKTLARLNHPGIVQVYGCGYFEGQYFYAMQYVEGATLEVSLARDESEMRQAVQLAIGVTSAIEHAHHHGVIHRDLKPENVIIEAGTGQPKVVDFGLAKQLKKKQHLTQTKAVLGTPVYMPPEQAAGNMSQVNESSDVFSLGAVLYSLLAGRPAFCPQENDASLTAIVKHRADPPSMFNPMIDKDLDAICLKSMAAEKHHRYANPLELQRDLVAYLEGKPVTANPRGVFGNVWKWYTADAEVMLIVAGILQIVVSLAFILWGLCGIAVVSFVDRPADMVVRDFITEGLLLIFAMYLPLLALGVFSTLNHQWASKISLGYWVLGILSCLVFMAPDEMLNSLSLLQVSGLKVLSQFARMQLCNLICLIAVCCAATHAIPIIHRRLQQRKLASSR